MHPELVHREQPSPNWDERALPVTMVVLHYTEMERDAALQRLTDPDRDYSELLELERGMLQYLLVAQ